MKKIIFVLLFILLMTGCAQNQEVQKSKNEISKTDENAMTVTEQEETDERQEITLGCMNSPLLLDNMNKIVKAYNRKSKEYYVKLVPYGEPEEGIISGANDLALALVKEREQT